MKLSEVKCKFSWTDVIITTYGAVGFCCYTVDKFAVGNLTQTSFDNIWNNEKARAWRRAMLTGGFAPECLQVSHFCPFQNKL
jgi:radical SAM protein with 4Fe4S-binding SPASM domain